MQRLRTTSRRGGFTLIEILAVILIVGILAAFLTTRLSGATDSVQTKAAESLILQLATQLEEYEREKGDYPESTFPSDLDPKPTKTNMGAEALVIALAPADGSYTAFALPEDDLCNTDGDDTKRSLTTFANSECFEIADPWGNPIAYLHSRDYGQGARYATWTDADEAIETQVTGAINPTTRNPFNSKKFQLISAGSDGRFGTDDDIGNFRRPR